MGGSSPRDSTAYPAEPGEPPSDSDESRLAVLTAELAAAESKSHQALIHYEMGYHYASALGDQAQAAKEFLTSYNLDPNQQNGLLELLCIFGRRNSAKNLDRLYLARARGAANEQVRVSALLDRGALLIDHLGKNKEGTAQIAAAFKSAPQDAAAALFQQQAALSAGADKAAHEALRARATHTKDLALRVELLGELAEQLAEAGKLEEALAVTRQALEIPVGGYRTTFMLERLARRWERQDIIAEALQERARLAAAFALGSDANRGGSYTSTNRFRDPQSAAKTAAALYAEAAAIHLYSLSQADRALEALKEANALLPGEVFLEELLIEAARHAGDLEAAAERANKLIARSATGPLTAPLWVDVAALAERRADTESARAALMAANTCASESPTAEALLDEFLLRHDCISEYVERLERRGRDNRRDTTQRVEELWKAGHHAAYSLGDFQEAERHLRASANLADSPAAIEQDLYGSALVFQATDAAKRSLKALLEREIGPQDFALFSHELFDLLQSDERSQQEALEHLQKCVTDERCLVWAPDAARIVATSAGDYETLSRAHRSLASAASGLDVRAAHFCAAARAEVRAGASESAIQSLRQAIESVPGHRYAVALLEELYRNKGRHREVVDLLRGSASTEKDSRRAELALVLAGATAESIQDGALAERTYEEAIDRDPVAESPLWALKRLAERNGDNRLLLKAYEALSEREVAKYQPGAVTLELGEHYDLITRKPELAEPPLRAALRSDDLQFEAAIEIALLDILHVDPDARGEAIETLLEQVEPEDRELLARELAGTLLCDNHDPMRAERIATTFREASQHPWTAYCALRATGTDAGRADERATWWAALAETAPPDEAAEYLLHSLRVRQIAFGTETSSDTLMLAEAIQSRAPGSAAAAVAIDEALEPGDDPETRVRAFRARLVREAAEARPSIEAALARALTSAGQARQALEIQQRLIDAHPRKLSLWESLRHSARAAQDWTTVATACDRLAEALDGEVRAQLLEEGAVVRIDHLGDELGAMQRLREVLKFDAARPLAYGRLHDLLVRRSATTELLALVTTRIEAVDDFEDLAELYYEQARLQRALGNRDTALAVIDNLMMLDEHHVGGLALAAEIFVSLERFEAAIERLQLLAAADVPPRQQRIARLGAADFLSTKLDRHEAALAELDRLIHAGIDNLSVHIKIAKVARSAEHWDRAAEALATAASLTEGDQRADLSVKAARIHRKHRKDPATAVQSLRYALTAVADHLEAGEELASTLTHPSEVREFCRSFEDAVRHKLSSNPYDSDHLRKLAAVARWRDEHHLEQAVLQILDAIGLSTHEEQQNVDLHPDVPRPGPKGASPEDLFEELRLPRSIRGSSFDQLAKLSALTLEPIDDLMNRTLEAATVTRKNLIPSRQPHPLRDALHNCSVLLNAGPVTEVYFGGNEPKGIRIYLGRRKKGAIVFGASVQTPLDARSRFLLGRQLVGLRCSSLHLIDRSPREAAMLLHATAAASEVKLDTASRYPELPRYRDALQKSLSRRQRRAIAEVITSLSDHIKENDQIFEQWCETVRKEANRGGLMLAGDIRPAVQALFGADHTLRHLQENKEATDMVGFWLASDTLRLRRNMSVAR